MLGDVADGGPCSSFMRVPAVQRELAVGRVVQTVDGNGFVACTINILGGPGIALRFVNEENRETERDMLVYRGGLNLASMKHPVSDDRCDFGGPDAYRIPLWSERAGIER